MHHYLKFSWQISPYLIFFSEHFSKILLNTDYTFSCLVLIVGLIPKLQHVGKEAGKHEHLNGRLLKLNNLELLLKDVSPHRECLWNGLVPNLV
jgi:hypothetical protein